MAVTDRERIRIAEAARDGRIAPTGPIVQTFNPLELAAALEGEAERALLLERATGSPSRVDMHMDPRDALLLAEVLRRVG